MDEAEWRMINRISKTSLLLATCKLEQNLDSLSFDCSISTRLLELGQGLHFFHALCLSRNRWFSCKYIPWKLEAFFGYDGSKSSLHLLNWHMLFGGGAMVVIEINNLQRLCVRRAFK